MSEIDVYYNEFTFKTIDGIKYDKFKEKDNTYNIDDYINLLKEYGYIFNEGKYFYLNANDVDEKELDDEDYEQCKLDILYKVSINSGYKILDISYNRLVYREYEMKDNTMIVDLPYSENKWISFLKHNKQYVVVIKGDTKIIIINFGSDNIKQISDIDDNVVYDDYIIYKVYTDMHKKLYIMWLLDTLFSNTTDISIPIEIQLIDILDNSKSLLFDPFEVNKHGLIACEGIEYKNMEIFFNSYFNDITRNKYHRALSNHGNNGEIGLSIENGSFRYNNRNIYLYDFPSKENHGYIRMDDSKFIELIFKVFDSVSKDRLSILGIVFNTSLITPEYIKTSRDNYITTKQDYIVIPAIIRSNNRFYSNRYMIYLYIKRNKIMIPLYLFNIYDYNEEYDIIKNALSYIFDYKTFIDPKNNQFFTRKYLSNELSALYAIWLSTVILINIDKIEEIKPSNYVDFITKLNSFVYKLHINEYINKTYYINGFKGFLRSFLDYIDTLTINPPKVISGLIVNLPKIPEKFFKDLESRKGSSWIGTFDKIDRAVQYVTEKFVNTCDTTKQQGIYWDYYKDIDSVEVLFPKLSRQNILQCFNNKYKRFIIIPIFMRLYVDNVWTDGHLNIVLYDKMTKQAERFEPHGYSNNIFREKNNMYYKLEDYTDDDRPVLDYDNANLDEVIEKELNNLLGVDNYYPPEEYCPKIGFQSIELNIPKSELDPGGYCAAWSIFYIEFRLLNPNIDRKMLISLGIEFFNKIINIKQWIRTYSEYLSSQ